jgi:imidazolonepropionase-like amidohydrolase
VPRSERPDIEAAGRLIAIEEGYYPGLALEIDPGEIEAVVHHEAERAAGWVKLIGDWPRRGVGPVPNFDEATLRRAVESAARSGARVAIHTMAREVPSMAVAAGVDSIEHGLFLTEGDLAVLGERAGMWVPTVLRIEETLRSMRPGSSGELLIREGLANVSRLLGPAVEAGVIVLAGTDLVGSPANVASEAIRLAQLGLGAADAVRSVSVAGFAATGRDPTFPVGGDADAVFFPANPVEEPGCLAHPVLVMRHGRVL